MSKSVYKAVANIDFPTALYYNHRAGQFFVSHNNFQNRNENYRTEEMELKRKGQV